MEIKSLDLHSKDGLKKVSIASGPVIIENNKVLLVRGKGGTHFKFPGGYQFDNESYIETAIREAKEEINCEIEVIGNPIFYQLRQQEDDLEIILVHYKAQIKSGEPTPSSEIDEMVWFELNKLPENVMENVKVVVSEINI